MRVLGILVLLALLPLVPFATASCSVGSDADAISAAGTYYVVVEDDYYGGYYDVSFWREANGHAGLQRYARTCPDGTVVAPDREL